MAADLLGVRVARKALQAVAGLISVHDHTWTTDRPRAARRWSELEPDLAGHALADDGIVSAVVERFGRLIGLWTDDPEGQ